MMNSGNKIYIYKDGFGDVYSASPAEEAEWAQEVIAAALIKINVSENSTELKNAVDNLRFHGNEGLDELLLSKLKDASLARRSALETLFMNTALHSTSAEIKRVEIIYQHLVQHGNEGMHDVFLQFDDFKSKVAKLFILTCVEGNDDELFIKATITLGRWAYSGMPALRQNRLLETLQPENRHLPTFKPAVEQLKLIFQINP